MRQTLVTQLSFACSRVGLELQGPEAIALGRFLFSGWPQAEWTGRVRLRLIQSRDGFELWEDGLLIHKTVDKGAVAENLQARATRMLLEKSQGGLAFHAAGLSAGDRAVILPAQSGSGKTTLCAWLAGQGYSCLCDDVVWVPWGLDRLVPLRRPVQIKGESRTVLAPHFNCRAQPDQVLHSENYCLAPCDLLGPPAKVLHPRLSLIVFPSFRPGAELVFRRLSPAQTGLALMECLVNARNLAGHGLDEALRLARLIPAWRLVYSHFEQLDSTLLDLMGKYLR